MTGFFTDKDGKVRPITPKKGAGLFVSAVVVACAVAATGGGLGGAASVGGAADSAVSQGVRTGKANSKDAARKGQQDEAWRRVGLRVTKKSIRQELDCIAHSFGQVQQFFVREPCRSLQRALLAIGDAQGNTVVVSIAWVRMPTAASAGRFKRLVDTDGTGNVSPIASEVLDLRGIRFTGQHYDSRSATALVVVAEAAPGGGQPEAEVLDAAAEIAAEFPPP